MLEYLQTYLAEEWAIRALIASSLVGIMCGVLGCFIVLRNMALIGDALSHAILPGVVGAYVLVGISALGLFFGAVIAGLVTAVGITWIQQNIQTKNDAAIGIVFTAMFSIGVMWISAISHQGGHLELDHFLFGRVLGIGNDDLYLTAAITAYVILSIVVFYRYLFVATFQPVIAQTMGISVKILHYFLMLLLSFAVVASLRTVGVILVVSMLITPAATALLLSNRLRVVLFISAIVGLLSAVLGLLLSFILDTTPGPAMAVTATAFYLLAALFSPTKGLVFRYFRKLRMQSKIEREDILKQSLRLREKGKLSISELKQRLGFSLSKLNRHLTRLQSQNLLSRQGDQLTIHQTGIDEAKRLVRAHRLWETYLVQQMGLTEEQIHEEAEKFEHLLTEDLLDEVDETLGFPTTDPHGSPIPAKKGIPIFPLIKMEDQQAGSIAQEQVDEHISAQLWQMGLLPGTEFKINRRDQNFVELGMPNKQIQVPKALARKINIITT